MPMVLPRLPRWPRLSPPRNDVMDWGGLTAAPVFRAIPLKEFAKVLDTFCPH
jgi:hypothetical protein